MCRKKHRLQNRSLRRGLKARMVSVALCVVALSPLYSTPTYADNGGPMATAVDVAFARPISLAATIIGSALFIISLPVAIPSGSVKDCAHALVVAPATDTFIRPVGDLDDFMSYY